MLVIHLGAKKWRLLFNTRKWHSYHIIANVSSRALPLVPLIAPKPLWISVSCCRTFKWYQGRTSNSLVWGGGYILARSAYISSSFGTDCLWQLDVTSEGIFPLMRSGPIFKTVHFGLSCLFPNDKVFCRFIYQLPIDKTCLKQVRQYRGGCEAPTSPNVRSSYGTINWNHNSAHRETPSFDTLQNITASDWTNE